MPKSTWNRTARSLANSVLGINDMDQKSRRLMLEEEREKRKFIEMQDDFLLVQQS